MTTAKIIVTNESATTVSITLESQRYEPQWSELVSVIAQTIFLEQPLVIVADQPTFWDEINLAELTSNSRMYYHPKGAIGVGFIAKPTREQIQACLETTDFELGTLNLAQFDPADPQQLGEYLTMWLQRGLANPPHTTIEWLECQDDDYVFWHNPTDQHREAMQSALQQFAQSMQWELLNLSTRAV